MEPAIIKLMNQHLEGVNALKEPPVVKQIEVVVATLVKVYQQKHKILIMGNGGSAADAQHFAAEMVNTFQIDRRALPTITLTTNSSNLTAIGNDRGYGEVFSRQIEAYGEKGDAIIGITTSDAAENQTHSQNLWLGFQRAKTMGLMTIGLLSQKSLNLTRVVDLPIIVKGETTARIQEGQMLVEHIICDLVEKKLFV
jgi:D-sedoheptulose 7-phosphate isomerase